MKLLRLLLVVLFLSLPFIIFAQRAGEIDTTFNPSDVGHDAGEGPGYGSTIHSIGLMDNGQIYISTSFSSYNGFPIINLARVNADGTLDTSFNPGDCTNWTINSILPINDGKVMLGGYFDSINHFYTPKVARLNSNGSIDTSFHPGTGPSGGFCQLYSMVSQNDNRIIIAGWFNEYNGIERKNIARIHSDGLLDTSFKSDVGANNYISSIALQPNEKIIIAGSFTSYGDLTVGHIARLNSDGSLDTSFHSSIGADSAIISLSLQQNGKLIITGTFDSYNNWPIKHIARLNSDGTIDTTFNPHNSVDKYIYTNNIQGDEKIIIGGDFTSFNGTISNRIARLNIDGSLDTTFQIGTGADWEILDIDIQPDNKILIGGSFNKFNKKTQYSFTRLNSDGTLDESFNKGTAANDAVLKIIPQPDNKIIAVGGFTLYNDTICNFITRLNENGSLDQSFDPGEGADNTINSALLLENGKIVIGGSFTSYDGLARNHIARIFSNGQLDTAFNPGTGASWSIETMIKQPDGKIIIGGSFTSFDGMARNRIARIYPDGKIDTTFNPGTGASSYVRALALLPDKRILVGGDFLTFNDQAKKYLVLLDTNGLIDDSFIYPNLNGCIYSLAVSYDGKIYAGGSFTNFNDSINYIACFNPNGTYNQSFNSGNGPNNNIASISLLPDAKIIITGDFTTFNGINKNRIIRLNEDGSIDTSFHIGEGANKAIYCSAFQNDGKLLIGGLFNAYNGKGRNHIARLYSEPVVTKIPFAPIQNENQVIVFPNPSFDGTINIFSSLIKGNVRLAIHKITGELVFFENTLSWTGYKEININNLPKGIYILSIQSKGYSQNIKIIHQ